MCRNSVAILVLSIQSLSRRWVMSNPTRPDEGATVSCAVCLKELPADQASKVELEDYVRYFCGLDCYQKWQQQEGKAAEE
jgi:hypothetical protein